MASVYERGISAGSVSKVLGLQGLRIGWLISQDLDLVDDCLAIRLESSELINVLGEAIVDIVLAENRYQATLDAARKEGYEKLKIVDSFVATRPELEWQFPFAGYVGMCRLDMDISPDSFAARLLEAPYRTSVISGTAFGCPQHIRHGWKSIVLKSKSPWRS